MRARAECGHVMLHRLEQRVRGARLASGLTSAARAWRPPVVCSEPRAQAGAAASALHEPIPPSPLQPRPRGPCWPEGPAGAPAECSGISAAYKRGEAQRWRCRLCARAAEHMGYTWACWNAERGQCTPQPGSQAARRGLYRRAAVSPKARAWGASVDVSQALLVSCVRGRLRGRLAQQLGPKGDRPLPQTAAASLNSGLAANTPEMASRSPRQRHAQ